ncbi:unnamed protein product [Rotaria magnacalcarata]|uniref:Uncharacterized protein n=1 Tax=Rotaria magnacalcarata TaxID=392030 RepID=A0A8S2P7W1_9BILA|nr:unnamed protein product [Rotaria magnacalcarata]CAF4066764.1 unnamed protein product [Rotaria magnacalcarata]
MIHCFDADLILLKQKGWTDQVIIFEITYSSLVKLVKESWYNISRYILIQQIGNYDIARKARQLTKTDISHVATSLLDKCFHDTTSTSSVQPSCPLCSKAQSNLIIQTRTLSLILISGCVIFIVFIVLLHAFYSYHSHRSYQSI